MDIADQPVIQLRIFRRPFRAKTSHPRNRASMDAIEHAFAGGTAPEGEGPCDALSIEAVIRSHHDALIRFLRKRLRTPDDASDVAQETYIRMMQYDGSRHIQSPSSMLYRIAINVANDLGRSEQVRRAGDQLPLEEVELVSDQPAPDRAVSSMQDLSLLYEAIADLPPKCQQVFLLSRVRGMTYPEIAQHCGISVKMVEKHIGRALSVCLKKVGGA